MSKHVLFLISLVVASFSIAPWLQTNMVRNTGGHDSGNVFMVLFGEGRRIFADEMVTKADVYMHSGLYPSVFDQASAKTEYEQEGGRGGGEPDVANDAGHDDHDAGDHDERDHHEASFLGVPHDWIEAMGRHFMVTEHKHLHGGQEREVLPWLKLSADLDPQRIETYTDTAYWLADRLHKPKEAEEFLREGMRANPHSYEILFELGRIYARYLGQPDRARNLWKLALRRWDETEMGKEQPNKRARCQMLDFLAELESQAGHYPEAIRYFEEAKTDSPDPEALDARIKEVKAKADMSSEAAHQPLH